MKILQIKKIVCFNYMSKSVIVDTQEAESRKIMVWRQPRQIVRETLSPKTLHKNRAGGVAQGERPEFKPQYHKKKLS
jgi:hypothetical protein